MKIFLWWPVFLSSFTAPITQTCAAENSRPNVVIILADDMGWRDVGYHGSEIQTPRLDELARKGVTLERFYAQPTCSPTRAALMTGKTPMRLGVLRPISKNLPGGLPLAEKILPEYLAAAGYQTLMTGKWHLGHGKRPYLPNSRGFEQSYGHLTGGIGYWDHVHGGGYDWQRNGTTLREEGYSTHLIADEAVRLIKQRDANKPMLLYVSFNAPHLPNEAPEDSIARYAEIENPFRRVHAAMVTELDTAIGRVVDALAEEGILENTLIWFMSDNGGMNPASVQPQQVDMIKQLVDWYGEPLPLLFLEFMRTNWLEGGADNGPYRRGKNSVYEGGTRVPALVYWKGHTMPEFISGMVTAQDVLPTILDAIGIRATCGNFDGRSRWNTITGGEDSEVADYIVQGGDGIALYQYPWKLVLLSGSEPELYQIVDDPTEQVDQAVAEYQVVQRMRQVLDEFPRGESIHTIPLRDIVQDMDFFGGEEDRPPWADVVE